MPKLVINEMRGMNATRAKLQLKPGEIQFSQNLRGRPFDNWAKRRGIEAVSSDTSPIMGIFEIELDNIIIPIFQAGGTLTFFPNTGTASGSIPTPSPYPVTDPLDPDGVGILIFLIEPIMRAITERRTLVNRPLIDWPKRLFDVNGPIGAIAHPSPGVYTGGQAPATRPASDFYAGMAGNASVPINHFYQYDLFSTDAYFGDPIGTRVTFLVNEMRNAINSNGFLNNYVRAIEALPSVSYYDTINLPVPAVAVPATFRSRSADIANAVRRLIGIGLDADQVQRTAAMVQSSLGATFAINAACATSQIGSAVFVTDPLLFQRRVYDGSAGCTITSNSAFSGGGHCCMAIERSGTTAATKAASVKIEVNTVPYSNYAGDAAYVYLRIDSCPSSFGSSLVYDALAPYPTPLQLNGQYTFWNSFIGLGTLVTSSFIPVSLLDMSSIGSSETRGWDVIDQVVVITPTFIYQRF